MGIQTLPVPAGVSLQETQITASGTFTVPTGVTKLWCHVYSGGNGGHSASTSRPGILGVAGSVRVEQLTVTPGSSLSATIGAGGAAGGGYGNCGAGNPSSFSTITANGPQAFTWYPGGSGYTNGMPGSSNFDVATSGSNAPANSGAGGGSTGVTARNGGSGRIIVRYLG
jgi:hypothetical protein